MDIESCLNPATRELFGLDVPFDAEVRRQVSVFRCQEVKGKKLILLINWLMAKAIPNKRPDHYRVLKNSIFGVLVTCTSFRNPTQADVRNPEKNNTLLDTGSRPL